MSFNDEPDQYLFTALLRPANSPDKRGAVGILKRVIALLRAGFPKATIRVRLDAGFASPEIFDYLDAEGVEYVVAMPKNSILERRAKRSLGRASRLSRESGHSERVYAQTRCAAGTWSHKRRVIIKAEVTRHPGREPKNLLQELRLHAARTSLARAQVWTLRNSLLKTGARVSVSVRRLVLHLPTSFPFLGPWGRIAARLGAQLA